MQPEPEEDARPGPRLVVSLVGRPHILWEGAPLEGLRRKGLALLCVLAVQGRPMPRSELAALLWGPGRLTNLRQELAALRRQPGAAQWLQAEEGWVAIRAETDVQRHSAALARGEPAVLPAGEVLEGLSLLDAPAFEDWRDQLSHTVEGLRLQASASAGKTAPAVTTTQDIREALADLLSAAAAAAAGGAGAGGEVLAPEVLEQALAVTPWQIIEGERQLRAVGWLSGAGVWQGPPRSVGAQAQRRLGMALWSVEGPTRRAAALLEGAGAVHDLTRLLVARAREGDRESAERALAVSPEVLRAEVLPLAAMLALRAEDGAAFSRHWGELAAVARDRQSPPLLLEVALLRLRHALVVARDLPEAEAAWQQAAQLVAHHPELGAEASAQVALWEGQIALMTGQDALAEAALERASAATGEEAAHRGTQASAWAALGALLARQGRLAEAEGHHDRALAATRALRDRAAAGRMLNNLGATAERLGRLRVARDCFADALALAESLQDRSLHIQAMLNLAEVQRRLGALGESRRLLAALFSGGTEALSPHHRAFALQLRADLELTCGRLAEAARWFVRAAQASGASPTAEMAGWLALLSAAPTPLPEATWSRLADEIPQRVGARADLGALCWEELLRWAPDAACAARATQQREALLGPLSPALAALATILQRGSPPPSWTPGETLDDALALAALCRQAPSAAAWDALRARRPALTAGLLPTQAAALCARLGLPPPEDSAGEGALSEGG